MTDKSTTKQSQRPLVCSAAVFNFKANIKLVDLKTRAKELGIKRYSKMCKADLMDTIRQQMASKVPVLL